MVSRESFLAMIIEHPADDGPRLVYADWLEEQGEPERAEFIRVQIALQTARVHPKGHIVTGPDGRLKIDDSETATCKRDDCPRCTLRRRENELLLTNWVEWARPVPAPSVRQDRALLSLYDLPLFRRGFIESIPCSWADWFAHADAIRREQPVTAVTLTTRPIVWEQTVDGRVVFDLILGRTRAGRHGRNVSNDDLAVLTAVMTKWPGIEFTLPPAAADIRTNDDGRPYLHSVSVGSSARYALLMEYGGRAIRPRGRS